MFQGICNYQNLKRRNFAGCIRIIMRYLDYEWGETDLVQLEIDTGDAQPRRSHPRRLPMAAKQEGC